MDTQFEPAGFGWADSVLAMMAPTGMPPAAFAKSMAPDLSSMTTMDPYFVSKDAVERFGQVTPPEDLTPGPAAPAATASPSMDAGMDMSASAWTTVQQMRDLKAYEASLSPIQQQQPSPSCSNSESQPQPQPSANLRASKRRRAMTSKSTPANQVSAFPTPASLSLSLPTSPPQDPQPAKRRRGRPKTQPQPSVDGYPFPVSSARQSHLEKNRLAAHKCRQRRKEYISSLETRARDYSDQNQNLKNTVSVLREEVLSLKNILLQHAGCGCWAIDEYLKRSAGDLLGIRNSPDQPRRSVSVFCPSTATAMAEQTDANLYDKRRDSALLSMGETPTVSQDDIVSVEDQCDFDDMGGLLNDFVDGSGDGVSND